MPLSADTVTALQALIDSDPDLQARLANAGSPDQAAALLADAVRTKAPVQGQPSDSNAALSEEQLDAVSGGFLAPGEPFKGLPMGDLIGGPLMSAIDAQARLAAATRAFIDQVGLKP